MVSTQGIGVCLIITCICAAHLQADTAILPSADARIMDGPEADKNLGKMDLFVKADGKPGFNRKAYLRFDLSGVTEPINDAALRLTLDTQGEPPVSFNYRVFGLRDNDRGDRPDGWVETGLTWNNAPANAISSANGLTRSRVQDLGTFSVSSTDIAGQVYQFAGPRLMAFLRADSNRLVTFIIVRDGIPKAGPGHVFASREAGESASPKLMLSPEPDRSRDKR